MAKAPEPAKVRTRERLRQIGMVFSITAKRDKKFVPLALAIGLLPVVITVLLFALAGFAWFWLIVGVLLGVLGVLILLNTRATRAMMASVEGQPGAAASVIETMRGDWRLTPAVASTTQFDMVHLVVGRPGVILIGEGNPSRVRGLLGQEKRRLAKVIGSTEMYDFVVGNDAGQVPLEKLRTAMMKLPRTISAKDVNTLNGRLKALTARPQMPKGAIPKNMRPQMGGNFKVPRGR